MDISDNCSLYPLTSINNKKEVMLSYVNYTRGICELDRDVSIIIDLAEFLGTTPVLNKEELIILRVSVKKGDFALIIPAPKMTRSDIQFEEGTDKIKSSDVKIPLISSNYVILDNEVYLRIDVEQLSNYIANELSNYLTQEWKTSIPNFSFENNDNLAKIVEQSFTARKTSGSIIANEYTRNNIIICKVGEYQFSFSEKYMSELKYFSQIVTAIPDSPDWVKGAIDDDSESLPLVDLGAWLDIKSNETNDKLLVIIKKDKSNKFGFLCDSVSNIEKPENVPVQHVESLNIADLPFKNIIYNENKFIFSLNIDTLASSISTNNSFSSKQEWDNWKAFLNQNTNDVIDSLSNKTKDNYKLDLLDEFVEVNFQHVNILLDLGENLTFYTDQPGTKIKQYPHYCDGLVELGGIPSLIIDFAKYLGITDNQIDEYFLIKIIDKNGSIALKVPIPKVVRYNIDSKSTIILDGNNQSIRIPSSQYLIIEEKVYLKFDQETIFEFLENEMHNHLSFGWKNALPNWDSLRSDTLAKMEIIQTKMMNYTSNKMVKSSSTQSNNLLICKVEASYFTVKEDDIVQVISTEIKVTNIPDSPSWIQGVMDYQNKDIVVVDLSKLLQLRRENNMKPIIVLISTSTGPIAFKCNSVYHLSEQDMLSIKEYDLTSSNLPYNNVYDVNGRVIFHLNVEYLQNSISEKRDILSHTEWANLLSVGLKDYQKNQLKDEKDQLYGNNSLLVRIGNDNYNIPIDDIITITTVNDQERVTSNELNLLAYGNSWIPSVTIGDQSGSEMGHKMSLILKCDDFVFELQVDELRLVELGQQLIDTATWNTIIGGSSPIGLKTPSHTETGLSFGLDLNDLLLNSYSSVIRDDINFTDFINGLSLDPPSLVEESTVISKQIANIWEDDIELYLIIVDSNENTKSALNTELIASIALESDPNIELFPWENNKSESHFYVTTTAIDDHQKALQIPANCYLLGVGRESINSDDRFTYVTLEDEKIPILKIKNKI